MSFLVNFGHSKIDFPQKLRIVSFYTRAAFICYSTKEGDYPTKKIIIYEDAYRHIRTKLCAFLNFAGFVEVVNCVNCPRICSIHKSYQINKKLLRCVFPCCTVFNCILLGFMMSCNFMLRE